MLLELRVEQVNNFLDGLVRNDGLKWTASKVGAALGALLSVLILVEILVDAALAEGVKALVDGMRIPKKASA